MKEPVASSSIKDQEMSDAKCKAEVFLCERHVCHRYTSQAITNMNQNSVSNGQLNNSDSARPEFSGKLILLLFFSQQDI